jgi:hypothetical protein
MSTNVAIATAATEITLRELIDQVTAILPFCPADFNRDEVANSQDFFAYLTAFFTAEPAADFDGDGLVNSQDFFAFVTAYFAGCP